MGNGKNLRWVKVLVRLSVNITVVLNCITQLHMTSCTCATKYPLQIVSSFKSR